MRALRALGVIGVVVVGGVTTRAGLAQDVPAGGPRASVFVTYTSYSAARRVQPTFHVDEDAYALVGHMGPDGVVRILFPASPEDDGFVRAGERRVLPDVFAGFAQEYSYRYRTAALYGARRSQFDSYDGGGGGYVFVVASRRPLQLDRLREGNRWASYEVSDDEYYRDPRPAVYELAQLVGGGTGDAYTVKFASYLSSFAVANYGAPAWSYSAFGDGGFCPGDEPLSYFMGTGPFGAFGNLGLTWGGGAYGRAFMYRGTTYRYDVGRNCYRAYYAPPVVRIVQAPVPGRPVAPVAPTTSPIIERRREADGPRTQPNDVARQHANEERATIEPRRREAPRAVDRRARTMDDPPSWAGPSRPSMRDPFVDRASPRAETRPGTAERVRAAPPATSEHARPRAEPTPIKPRTPTP